MNSPMNSPALEQLSDEWLVRQRLIEEARRLWNAGDLDAGFAALLRFAEHVQSNERRLLDLTVQCHSMIQLCQKAIESEAMRRPMVVHLDSDHEKPR